MGMINYITKSNILFVRTVDTGSLSGRVRLYKIKDVFRVDGILVTESINITVDYL